MTKTTRIITIVMLILTATAVTAALAQSESAYDVGGRSSPSPFPAASSGNEPAASNGLLDPSRFTINHAMSFYAGGASASDIKSQSMYSTMFRYKFDAPVVFSLNFDMPIHSTFNQYGNLTSDNLQSMDYFRNMPIDAAITWMPKHNVMLGVRVIKMPESASPYYYTNPKSPFHHNNRIWAGPGYRAGDW